MHLEGMMSSGLLTADAAVVARPCLIHAVTLVPAAADSSIIVYDSAAASGTAVAKITALANAKSEHVVFPHPIQCNTGAYADISGASAGFILYFSLT